MFSRCWFLFTTLSTIPLNRITLIKCYIRSILIISTIRDILTFWQLVKHVQMRLTQAPVGERWTRALDSIPVFLNACLTVWRIEGEFWKLMVRRVYLHNILREEWTEIGEVVASIYPLLKTISPYFLTSTSDWWRILHHSEKQKEKRKARKQESKEARKRTLTNGN